MNYNSFGIVIIDGFDLMKKGEAFAAQSMYSLYSEARRNAP